MLRMNRSVYNTGAGIILPNATVPTTNTLGAWAMANRLNFDALAAVPAGYNVKKGIVPPLTGGAMSSYKRGVIGVSGVANGALGLNGIATGTITIDGAAIGGLIVGGVALATITIGGTVTMFAALQGVANAVIAINGSGTASAIGHVTAAGTIEVTGTAEAYGVGWMDADSNFGTELTPQSLAAAVWAALAAEINTPGTAGAALLSAGSAGDPWGTPLPGGYVAGTAGAMLSALINGMTPDQQAQLIRIEKILRNKQVTDPVAGTMTVYDDDGSTVLLTGPLFEDAAGVQAYRGQGAERRERLA